MDLLDPKALIELTVAAGGFAVWFALLGLALLLTRSRDVPPAPASQDFGGDEPPAVVSLLANRWEITEDAPESTLIDLAARRILEFRQPANDPAQTTVHVRVTDPAGLTPYEQRVFDRVAGLADGRVVPLTALTFRDPGAAESWMKGLRAEVLADARQRGLSQRRFPLPAVAGLALAGVVPAAAVAHTMTQLTRRIEGRGLGWLVGAAAVAAWVFCLWHAGHPRGERDTAAGREVAARWLGLRAYLRNDESFANLPPAAVAVWDRYLSYGDALGVTRVCQAVIDLGMGNRRRVWSSFGGTWHRVRVRYPGFWPRYGGTPGLVVTRALIALGLAYLLVRTSGGLLRRARDDFFPQVQPAQVDSLVSLLVVGLVAYGVYALVTTVADLLTPVTRTGEVLWLQVWKSTRGSENSPPKPWLHHLAVDDGSGDRTVAWGCPSDLLGATHCGDVVRITARRWSRRVTRLEVVEAGRQRALAHAHRASGDHPDAENVVVRLMSQARDQATQTIAGAGRVPDVSPAQLVSAEDASRALGTAVVAKGLAQAAVGPVTMEEYRTAQGGRKVLYVTVSSGPVADLAIRMRRRHRPLPGIGDEAYAGDTWFVGRRGQWVVTLQLHGTGKRADPEHMWWLLSRAVDRLPG